MDDRVETKSDAGQSSNANRGLGLEVSTFEISVHSPRGHGLKCGNTSNRMMFLSTSCICKTFPRLAVSIARELSLVRRQTLMIVTDAGKAIDKDECGLHFSI